MKSLRNSRGVAMLMALTTMVILGLLVGELVYEVGVYNSLVFRQRDQFRAELLAKSALRIAILQLHATQLSKAKMKTMGLEESMADKIWQTPLILPPPTPPGLGPSDTEALAAFKKSLGLEGMMAVVILPESDKLSLNNLVWLNAGKTTNASTNDQTKGGTLAGGNNPAPLTPEKQKEALKAARNDYVNILKGIIDQKKESDDKFREKYQNLNPEVLIGNLVAWMDPNTTVDGDGADKKDYYSKLEPPIGIKEGPLTSESELHLIKDFDDTIVKIFTENFTVQSTSSLNVNKASVNLIRALIPELEAQDAEKIIKRRENIDQGGPFASESDFWKFIEPFFGSRFQEVKKHFSEKGIKILDSENAFRVIVTGESGAATKTWVASIGPPPPDPQDAKSPTAPGTTKPPDISKPADQIAKDTEKKEPAKGDDNKLPTVLYLKTD